MELVCEEHRRQGFSFFLKGLSLLANLGRKPRISGNSAGRGLLGCASLRFSFGTVSCLRMDVSVDVLHVDVKGKLVSRRQTWFKGTSVGIGSSCTGVEA